MNIQPSDQAYALALQAIYALRSNPLEEGLPNLWSRCLILAAQQAGLDLLPAIGVYHADGVSWYGYRIGPLLNVSSCGIGLWSDRLLIRVRISDFNTVMRPRRYSWRMLLMAGRGEIWFFSFNPDGRIEIMEGERQVTSFRGITGEKAVTSAILETLTVQW